MIQNLLDKYKALSIIHQRIIAVVLVAIISFLIFLSVFSNQKREIISDYKMLFDNLSAKDIALIIEKLDRDEVPYRLDSGGIRVHKDIVYKKRIEFTALDIPKNSKKIGYGLFDKNEFGSTDFEQKIKYLRSLEGEIVNTLSALAPIVSAQVHIAIPKESVFVSRQVSVTASVALLIREGMHLSPSQIKGIKNLVAFSVPKLSTANVKLTNSMGQPLGDSGASYLDEISKMQLKYKQDEEFKLEVKIVELLSPFLGGSEAVIAKATIDFDFTQTNIKSEEYDPSNVIRSKQTLEENQEGFTEGNKGGVPGAVSNIGPVQGLKDKTNKNKKNKNEQTVNYEISKKVSETRGVFATTTRMSVAVAIDGKYTLTEIDGVEQYLYAARTKEELQKIETLVKNAMGFNKKRTDSLNINNFRFNNPSLIKIKTFADKIFNILNQYSQLINYLIAGAILYIFYKTVLTPFIDRMLALPADALDAKQSIIKLGEIEEEEEDIDKSEDLRKKILAQLSGEGVKGEEQIRYELILDKLRDSFQDNPANVATFLGTLIKA